MVWQVLLGLLAGLLVAYLLLLGLILGHARSHPDTVRLADALRLVPDLVRLLRRLAADRAMSRGVRIRLLLVLAYLASPIDLVPDFVPIVGYADDAVIVTLVLRSVVRDVGPGALDQHWPGTPAGLAVIRRLAGLPARDH